MKCCLGLTAVPGVLLVTFWASPTTGTASGCGAPGPPAPSPVGTGSPASQCRWGQHWSAAVWELETIWRAVMGASTWTYLHLAMQGWHYRAGHSSGPGRFWEVADGHVCRLLHHIHVFSVLPEVQIPFPWIPENHLPPNAVVLRRNSLTLLHREESAEMLQVPFRLDIKGSASFHISIHSMMGHRPWHLRQ